VNVRPRSRLPPAPNGKVKRATIVTSEKVSEGKQEKPTVYVVDDDDRMREALGELMDTVGYEARAFARPSEFLEKYHSNQPGCLILDVRLPQLSGLDVQQILNRRGAMIPVILMTGHGDVPMAVQAMKDGAFDFLEKPFRNQALLDCINAALLRDAESRQSLEQHADLQRRAESLTPREREVMALVADGQANKVIAMDKGLSERTVEIHRANVMEKMAARSLAHLVRMHLTLAGEL
jgi:two-component system, LuxR family, response regulator FixJ